MYQEIAALTHVQVSRAHNLCTGLPSPQICEDIFRRPHNDRVNALILAHSMDVAALNNRAHESLLLDLDRPLPKLVAHQVGDSVRPADARSGGLKGPAGWGGAAG